MPITMTYYDPDKGINDKLYILIVTSLSDPKKVKQSVHPSEEGKQITDNIVCENTELNVSVFVPKKKLIEYSKETKREGLTFPFPYQEYQTYYNIYEKLDYIKNKGLVLSSIEIEDIDKIHRYENFVITNINRKRDIEEGDGNDIEITFSEWFVSNVVTVSMTREEAEQKSQLQQENDNLNAEEVPFGYIKTEEFKDLLQKDYELTKKAWDESGLLEDKKYISENDIDNSGLTPVQKSYSKQVFNKIYAKDVNINAKDTKSAVIGANNKLPINEQISYTEGEKKVISTKHNSRANTSVKINNTIWKSPNGNINVTWF